MIKEKAGDVRSTVAGEDITARNHSTHNVNKKGKFNETKQRNGK